MKRKDYTNLLLFAILLLVGVVMIHYGDDIIRIVGFVLSALAFLFVIPPKPRGLQWY